MKYKVSDLSKILNVSSNTIRRFEKMGYLTPGRSDDSGYRTYNNFDIDKIIYIEMCRKYRFRHKEISSMLSGDLKNYISLSERKRIELEEEIEYLTNVRKRLALNIKLMHKCTDYENNFSIKVSNGFHYVLFRDNRSIFKERERMERLHEFMYSSLPVQSVCIFPKDDLLDGKISYGLGIASKTEEYLKHTLSGTSYIEEYTSKESLFFVIKMDNDFDEFFENKQDNAIDSLFGEAFIYMKESGLELNGDVFGITLANVIEDGINVQYILMCFPIKYV